MAIILGIDVGGTGIKGGIVDLEKGELISERLKYRTPESKKPGEMIEVIQDIVDQLDWKSKPIGIGFPAIVKNNISYSASNIHDDWINYPIQDSISEKVQCPVYVINDADAAGLAEMAYGKGKDQIGTVLLLTLGTGIGSALFTDGVLVPNTEFGHLFYRDGIAEHYASNNARKIKELSWEDYGKELNNYLKHIQFIFSPNMILLGGGISKRIEFYENYLSKDLIVFPAEKLNNAGIIGAALAFSKYYK